MRHDFWDKRFYDVWFTLARSEPPYLVNGLWHQQKFEVEFVPRQYVIVRAAKEIEWLREAFSRTLGLEPSFQYQEASGGKFVMEWRMADREARWQALQGMPTYKNPKRLYAMPEY